MFNLRPKLTRQQQLAAKPVRLVEGQIDDAGRLRVPVRQRGWAARVLRMPKDATKTFEFDPLGRLVWESCDGKATVQQIARKLAKKYGVSDREAHVATEKFLTMLARKGLIGAAVKRDGGGGG